ncbi:MAG: helix-turn-helix domain-containing protein [Bacteroidales bacterium]|nr:helix-turn-helix domain-containing protein [Bacteroidales bacterium]
MKKLKPDTDLELIKKSMYGDMDAFKQIVEKYQNKVTRISTSKLFEQHKIELQGIITENQEDALKTRVPKKIIEKPP